MYIYAPLPIIDEMLHLYLLVYWKGASMRRVIGSM